MSTIRPLPSVLAANGVGTYTPNAGGTSSTLVGMPPPTQASSGTSNLEVYDEGVLLTPGATLLDFTGAGVTASAVGTAVTINVPAATITTQDEGVTLSSTVNTLNFVGGGVTASGAGATTTVTIPGSGFAPSGLTSTVTAAGTTTLTNASTEQQYFTGVTTQTVVLPVVTTLANGWVFKIVNRSTGKVTVQSSGGNTITILPGRNAWGLFTCVNTAGGTGIASWSWESGVGQSTGTTTAVVVGYDASAANVGSTVVGAGAASTSASSLTAVGGLCVASAHNACAFGYNAAASASNALAVGTSNTASAAGALAFGSFANNSIANGILFNATELALALVDTAHALGFGINAASVNPGSLGLTINSASYQLPLYTSLYASTATAAGTTTLTVTSARTQRFSGTTTQTCVLPAVTAAMVSSGFEFKIFNDSTGAVTVQSSAPSTITTLAAAVGAVNRGGWGFFVAVDSSGGGTAATAWSYLSGATIL